jgi:hypothetical protein
MVRCCRRFAYLGFPVSPMRARMLAWDGDGTDFRLSRNGDGAVPVAAHSLREWREAMVRWFAYLGLPATPMLARMFAWVGCDPIFDCRETEMGPRNSHLETLKENADCR